MKTYRRLLRGGKAIRAGRGAAREEIGSLLILKDPLSRLSRSESRATLYSCLGETLWYLAGSSSINRIKHYVQNYRKYIKNNNDMVDAPGAYGPRIFGPGVNNQIENIINELNDKNRRHTRKAVVQIFDKSDLKFNVNYNVDDVPCTISFQFFIRKNKLEMMCNMRSNDAFKGMPHDIFAFTFIQEYMARRLKVGLGRYIHAVGSLHLYDENEGGAKRYIEEGWQDPESMPAMPDEDPEGGLRWLLEQEESIRLGSRSIDFSERVSSYWHDLAKILLLKVLEQQGDDAKFRAIAHSMHSTFFDGFLRDHEARLRNPADGQLSLRLPLNLGDRDE